MLKRSFFEKISNIYVILGLVLIVLSIVFIAIPIAPYVAYRINPGFSEGEIENISAELFEEPLEDLVEKETKEEPERKVLPPLDTTLPDEAYVVIPKIDVFSPIGESEDPEITLREGTWMASDYGRPPNNDLPIILAAHRFGYVYWDRETRNRLSFYNLPRTRVGDKIKIIWEQREYEYEIYAEDDSTYVKDYTADLIIYTCKYFNSPQRIFRYAKRIN